jgi:hypothetical protein
MNLTPPRGAALPAALLAALLAAFSLAGCMGIDVGSVQHVPRGAATPAADEALAVGRIRFVVDGRPLAYGLLNKPRLQLRHEGRTLATPEVDAQGRFRWRLPAGEHRVAVIFGGMPPTGQAHLMPGGTVVFVNGIVDPPLAFSLKPGREQYLGTLVVEVQSRPAQGLLNFGERVFDRLLDLRVEDESPGDAPALPLALMRRAAVSPG